MKAPVADQFFEVAPIGTRVRLINILCFVLAIGGSVALGLLNPRVPDWPESFRMLFSVFRWIFAPAIIGAVWYGARLGGYVIAGDELRVKRTFYTPRFNLTGLVSVEPSSEPMRWAFKMCGNDGLGSIAGSFRSKQWGKFKAYISDTQSAVVLRWSDGRTLIVSPEKREYFILALRKHLG